MFDDIESSKLKIHKWRGGRVVEGARLESV